MMNREPESCHVYVEDGIKIHYWDWGNFGPSMLLLYLSGAFGRIWDPMAKLLYTKFHILALDLRGHGDSDKPKGDYSAEVGARDLLQLIEILKLPRVNIVSHSLGTRIGIVLAAENPEKVHRLVMAGGPHYVSLFPHSPEAKGDIESFQERARMWADAPKFLASQEEAMAFLRRPSSSLRTFDDQVLSFIISFNTNRLSDGRLEWKWDPEAVGGGLMHVPDDLTGYVSKLRCPILVPHGVRKEDLLPERIEAMKRVLPNSKWVLIPDTDYFMYLEKPAELARVILEFTAE